MKKYTIGIILILFLLLAPVFCPGALAWGQRDVSRMPEPQVREEAQPTLFSGGLLGAVLLGEPFKGITIPDVLALLGVALIGYRLFRISRGDSENTGPEGSPYDEDDARGPGMDSEAYRRARAYWDYMSGKSAPSGGGEQGPPPAPGSAQNTHAGQGKATFDTDDFLKGAKLVYGRIHDAVRNNDMEDLSAFTTPEMLERIQSKPGSLAKNGMIMFVDAELLDVSDIAGETKATVRFKALVQYAGSGKSEDVAEVWHFRKKTDDPKDTWRLQDTEHFQ